jgi:hypothetical protein
MDYNRYTLLYNYDKGDTMNNKYLCMFLAVCFLIMGGSVGLSQANIVMGGADLKYRNNIDGAYGIDFIDLAHRIKTDGSITSWSIYAGSNTEQKQVELEIYRENGSNYDLVGKSPLVYGSQAGGIINYTLSTPISVKENDIIGWYYPASNGGGAVISFDYTDGSVRWTEPWGSYPEVTGSVSRDYFNYAGNRVYSIQVEGTPVPLPSALLLFAPGLIGLAGLKRKYL